MGDKLEIRIKRKLKDKTFAIMLILPALSIIIFIMIYPLLNSIFLSLQNYNLIFPNERTFIFFKNFISVFRDEVFYESIKNTVIFVVSSIFGGFIMGLSLALVLNKKIVFRGFFRGIALIPWIIPPTIIALIFLYMFNSEVGIVNYILKEMNLISEYFPWFARVETAMATAVLANVWMQTPFYMLMFLSALQTIPNEIVEAAEIDGASEIKKFFHITLPYLRGVILIVITLMIIWNFNNFDIIWTTTKGGPIYSTTTVGIYVYKQAFTFYEIGYAAAIGVVWLIILLALSFVFVRIMERGKIE